MPSVQNLMGVGLPALLSGFLGDTKATALAAAGNGSQANGTAITSNVSEFTSVSTGVTDSAVLPVISGLQTKDVYYIRNSGSGTLLVYPGSGDKINNGSTNASVSLTTGTGKVFIAVTSAAWMAIP